MCRLLLQHGVDVDAQDMHGNTPLAAAARQGNSRVVFSLPPRWHACSIHIIYMMHIYARTCTYIAIHSVYDVYIHTHMYLRCDTFCIYIYTYTRTCTCIAIHSVLFFWLTHVFLQNDVHSCEPGKLVVVKRHVSRRKRHRVYLNVSTCVNRYIYREIFFDLT